MNYRTIRGINMGKAIVFMFIALYLALNPSAATAAAGKMYVTNYGNHTVSQANLDGTGGVSLGNPNGTLNLPYGIALDTAAGKMYVTNGTNTVSRANLYGSGGVSLGNLNGTLNSSRFIALDTAAGKMYVVNGNNTVSRANLDGTGGVSLGNLNGTLNGPVGIALAVAVCQDYQDYQCTGTEYEYGEVTEIYDTCVELCLGSQYPLYLYGGWFYGYLYPINSKNFLGTADTYYEWAGCSVEHIGKSIKVKLSYIQEDEGYVDIFRCKPCNNCCF